MPRSRLPLKNGVDLQLQSACNDGNWPVVIRLADKRARTSRDQYYETLKICAESQLDDPTAKFAAITALFQYVKDGTVIKDVDTLDLLDWACQDLLLEDDYADTLGVLRVRAVKATPKARNDAIRCLETCLLHWDLNSSQQIAAILDRTFPQERMFMFWNIVITHMYSSSPQSPPEKKKLYGMLAQKQIERAAQSTESEDGKAAAPANSRNVQTEEEILLLYAIVEQHGTPEDWAKLISDPRFGPEAQFRKGRKELFSRILIRYKRDGNWSAIFTLIKECLMTSGPETKEPNFLASDWAVWQLFIEAAAQIQSVDTSAQGTVQSLLLQFAQSAKLRPIYKRNVLLARLSAVFTLSPPEGDDVVEDKPTGPRLQELVRYIQDQFANPACFGDVKSFIERLDSTGLRWLATKLLNHLRTPEQSSRDAAKLELLAQKLRYFTITCSEAYETAAGTQSERICNLCSTKGSQTPCRTCLASIASSSLESAKKLKVSGLANPGSLLSEYAILTALCYVDSTSLAGNDNGPLLMTTDVRHLLKALFVLEERLQDDSKDSVISLLLVQLHLRVGSASRACSLWEDLGVKRTIVNSVAPILYDRLSSISPKALSDSDRFGAELSDCVRSHYETSLKLRMHRRLADAFEAESYSSILQIPQYVEDLRNGCTRAMSVIEESRAARLIDGFFPHLLEDTRYEAVSDQTSLHEVVDYGSFPSWASSIHVPVYTKLRIGPPPSNARSHLSLAAEAFHNVLNYKPPAIYKVPASTDPTFVVEMMSQLSNTFSGFLRRSESGLTKEESVYFDLCSLLTTIITLSTTLDRASAEDTLAEPMSAVPVALDSLKEYLRTAQGEKLEKFGQGVSNLHGLTVYRDTAYAARLACQWITIHSEREKEKDKSGQSGLPKGVLTQLKETQKAAEESLAYGKRWLKGVHEAAPTRAELKGWVLEGDESLRGQVTDKVLDDLVVSWASTAKAWREVRWE